MSAALELLEDVLIGLGAASLLTTLGFVVLVAVREILGRAQGPRSWEGDEPEERPKRLSRVARRCGWCRRWLDRDSELLEALGAPVSDGMCETCRLEMERQIEEVTNGEPR